MNLDPLLSLIQAHEAPKGFDQVYGGIPKRLYPPRPITQMTIGDVIDWQSDIRRAGVKSTAAGGFQIIRNTLRDYHDDAGLKLSDPFSAANQRRIAICLMKVRGLDDYVEGKISINQFGNNLAREWASLPCVSGSKKGRSYYDGDGLNKALMPVEPVLEAIRAITTQPPSPARTASLWGRIKSIFTGKETA